MTLTITSISDADYTMRNERVFHEHWNGRTFKDLAQELGLSAGRLQQIFRRELALRCKTDIGYDPGFLDHHERWRWSVTQKPRHWRASNSKTFRGETWAAFVERVKRNDAFMRSCEEVAEAQAEIDEMTAGPWRRYVWPPQSELLTCPGLVGANPQT